LPSLRQDERVLPTKGGNMGHIPHLLHFLFEETKIGGWVAVIGILIGGAIMWIANPFLVDTLSCTDDNVATLCTKTFDVEAFVSDVIGAILGGGVGVLIAMILVDLGVDKDKLGISDE
jgi:hypothetical protein